jgi:hypothetical protein
MMIGHNALQIPSRAAVAVLIMLRCHAAAARINVITKAMKHALNPGIFRILIATMSHIIGIKAKMNFRNITASGPLSLISTL